MRFLRQQNWQLPQIPPQSVNVEYEPINALHELIAKISDMALPK